MHNKDNFTNWLNQNNLFNVQVQSALNELDMIGRIYANKLSHNKTSSIWDIDSPSTIGRLFYAWDRKLTRDNSEYHGLRELLLYQAFLSEVLMNENPTIAKYIENCYDLKLRIVTIRLWLKYEDNSATSINQISEENKDLNFDDINEWVQYLFNLTAEQYLFCKGLISIPPKGPITWLSEKKAIEFIKKYIRILKGKYSKTPAKNYNQLEAENRDIDFSFFDALVMRVYDESAKDYITHKGFVEKSEPNPNCASTRFSDILDYLIQKYSTNRARDIAQVYKENPDIPAEWFNLMSKREYRVSAENLLISRSVIKKPGEKTKWVPPVKQQIPNRIEPKTKPKPVKSKPEQSLIVDNPSTTTKRRTLMCFEEWIRATYPDTFPVILVNAQMADKQLEGTSFAYVSILKISNLVELRPFLHIYDIMVFRKKGHKETKEALEKYSEYLSEHTTSY